MFLQHNIECYNWKLKFEIKIQLTYRLTKFLDVGNLLDCAMTIEFSSLLNNTEEKLLVHPREIFLTLNRGPGFSFPRDIQTEVMKQWFNVRDESDLIIKLNVGSGKTLVGLLLLQSSLNEKKGPALYVAPDNQLCQQVMKEAASLGLLVTENPDDPEYQAGEKICVVNVYKLFNGKSVFGVGARRIEIGSVVIDDAHACVSTLTDQFRVRLNHTKDSYKNIFKIFSEDLESYNASEFLLIEDSDPRAVIEVPFWSWNAHQSDVLKVLHECREDDDLKFTYPLIKDILPQCRCIIGGQSLEIEPYFPATDLISSFRLAKRRIYMTATLSDDSVICTHFCADSKAIKAPIVPALSQSMGERMILMPQELNPDLAFPDIRKMLVKLAKEVNVVVIVPSIHAADDWRSDADQVLVGEEVAGGIEKLRTGHVGLTVLINRYDGIDLPASACRVLVIAELPEVNSFADRIDNEVLSETTVNLRRQIERIEQGMGRGVRSNDDYCVVLLLGTKLTNRLRSPDAQEMLTPATKAQLKLSRTMAKKLNKPSLDEIESVIRQCLDRDPDWMKFSKNALIGIKADNKLRLDDSKLALRKAFDLARANQPQEALSVLDKVIDSAHEKPVKAWLLARKAALQHVIDAEGAQKTLIKAHSLEPRSPKPLQGTVYKKLTPIIGNQAATLIAYHQSHFSDSTTMILFVEDLCNDLQFSPNTSDKFEAAVNELAHFLGIDSQRPEKEYNKGPDNLWALPNGLFLVIECKNGVTAGEGIAKKDVGQLGQSMAWFKERYFTTTPVLPIMIHPERKLGQGASRIENMRVIDVNGLEKLRKNLKEFAQQLADPNIASTTSEVAKRLAQFDLNAETFVSAFSRDI